MICAKKILCTPYYQNGDSSKPLYRFSSREEANKYGETYGNSSGILPVCGRLLGGCTRLADRSAFMRDNDLTDFSCLAVPENSTKEEVDKMIAEIKLERFLDG